MTSQAAAKRAAARREDYAYYKGQQQCVDCRLRPAHPNRVSCEVCLIARRKRRKAARDAAAQEGKCSRCKQRRTRRGYKTCATCRSRANVQRRARVARRREQLQCACGAEVEFARDGRKTCSKCSAAAAKRQQKARNRARAAL